jgi:hypothetical protein
MAPLGIITGLPILLILTFFPRAQVILPGGSPARNVYGVFLIRYYILPLLALKRVNNHILVVLTLKLPCVRAPFVRDALALLQ